MCGIFGILNLTGGPPVDKEEGIRCTDALHHRGPDDSGFFSAPEIFLGHRRLSIIDLQTGRQPIFNEDGSRCIVFNGEVFNYRDIRQELIELGPSLHHPIRYRSGAARLGGMGSGLPGALSRHVQLRHLGRASASSCFSPATGWESSRCSSPGAAAASVSPRK